MRQPIVEPLTAAARLRFSVRDAVTVTRLFALRSTHELDAVAISIVMPVIFVLLFSYVFGSSMTVPGGDYRSYLLSGMLAQGTLFSAGTVAVAVATDMRDGVIDRFKTMPISRSSVLFGRTIATGVAGLPGLAVMTGCAFAVGLRPQRGLGETIGAFALIFCFAWTVCWVGAIVGLLASSPGAANGLTMVPSFLLAFVSNVHVDPARMPTWLRLIAEWNPLSAVVAAVRELFGTASGPAPDGVWHLQHPIVTTVAMTVVLFAVLVPWSVRLYSRMVR
jgi:ABC-2 type transport system permease protein